MEITKKQWEEIKGYVLLHSEEIWGLAVNHTERFYDAIVLLEGISNGKYKLVGVYNRGEVKHPDSLIIYILRRNWDTVMGDFEWEEAYEIGYAIFYDELHENEFWDGVMHINKLRIKSQDWKSWIKKIVKRIKYPSLRYIGELHEKGLCKHKKFKKAKNWIGTYSHRVLLKIKKAPGLAYVDGSFHFTATGSRLEVIDEEDGQVYEVYVSPLYRKI